MGLPERRGDLSGQVLDDRSQFLPSIFQNKLPPETSTDHLLELGCSPPSFWTKPQRVLTYPAHGTSPFTSPHNQAHPVAQLGVPACLPGRPALTRNGAF